MAFPTRKNQGAAKGGRQKEFDYFFRYRDSFGHFWSLFLMLLSLLSSRFCQTPNAELLLRRGSKKTRFGQFSSLLPVPPPFQKRKCYIFGSAKTDPVRFKWGFGEGRLKDKFPFFEAYKNPIPKRKKLLAKRPFL